MYMYVVDVFNSILNLCFFTSSLCMNEGGIGVNVTVNNILSLNVPLLDQHQQQQQQQQQSPVSTPRGDPSLSPSSMTSGAAAARRAETGTERESSVHLQKQLPPLSRGEYNFDPHISSSQILLCVIFIDLSCHWLGFQSDKTRLHHVFDKTQLHKPYYTLLAVADQAELLTILHTAGEQQHLLSMASAAPGAKKPSTACSSSSSTSAAAAAAAARGSAAAGLNISTKAKEPLSVDVSSSSETASRNPSSLRCRAMAAGCLSADSTPPPPSCSKLLTPLNRQRAAAGRATAAASGSGGAFDCSPRMADLLAQLNPMLSFAEIRESLGIPLGEVSLLGFVCLRPIMVLFFP